MARGAGDPADDEFEKSPDVPKRDPLSPARGILIGMIGAAILWGGIAWIWFG